MGKKRNLENTTCKMQSKMSCCQTRVILMNKYVSAEKFANCLIIFFKQTYFFKILVEGGGSILSYDLHSCMQNVIYMHISKTEFGQEL